MDDDSSSSYWIHVLTLVAKICNFHFSKINSGDLYLNFLCNKMTATFK